MLASMFGSIWSKHMSGERSKMEELVTERSLSLLAVAHK
jgi:hypothetical protein